MDLYANLHKLPPPSPGQRKIAKEYIRELPDNAIITPEQARHIPPQLRRKVRGLALYYTQPRDRVHPIPWCKGTGRDDEIAKRDLQKSQGPGRRSQQTIKSSSSKEVNWSSLAQGASCQPSTSGASATSIPPKTPNKWTPISEDDDSYDGFIAPTLGKGRGDGGDRVICQSQKNEHGVVVTKVSGWADYDNTFFQPIAMMSRKVTPEIMKRHSRHALKRNAMYYVRLANIVDPLNFFMEFITEPPKDGCATLEESLQRFYSKPGVAQKYALRTFRPVPGQMYAVYDEEQDKWERFRVHHSSPTEQRCGGFYMDRLKFCYHVPYHVFHELHPQFGNWPRHPINGGLTDIRPIGYLPEDANKPHFDWSQESIDFFKNYTKDKLFRAFIVQKAFERTDKVYHVSDEDRFTSLSVFLFEVGAKRQIPVNAWMIQMGHAVPIKSMIGWEGLVYYLHRLYPIVATAEESEKKNVKEVV